MAKRRSKPPAGWAYDQRGWWYRVDDQGKPVDDQRFTQPADYRRACTHAEQDHNDRCAWCGAQLDHEEAAAA